MLNKYYLKVIYSNGREEEYGDYKKDYLNHVLPDYINNSEIHYVSIRLDRFFGFDKILILKDFDYEK
jgi:hypothetical protein